MRPSSKLASTIESVWGAEGKAWLARFDDTLAAASMRWGLAELAPFPELSYHFVCHGNAASGEEVVLKLAVPNDEIRAEIAALGSYDGNGAVRLLDADEALAAVLLQRARPGETLASSWSSAVDAEHARIIASLMPRLWVPPPPGAPLASDWFSTFEKVQLPHGLSERADQLWRGLQPAEIVLLHGDLHHYNVLSQGSGFVAIDPKGIAGDPAFDVYALLRNPLNATAEELCGLANDRLRIVAEVTGQDLERLRKWGFAGVVMGTCLSCEEGDPPEDKCLELAEYLWR